MQFLDKWIKKYDFYKIALNSGILFNFLELQISRADWAADWALTQQPRGATLLAGTDSLTGSNLDRTIKIRGVRTDPSRTGDGAHRPTAMATPARWTAAFRRGSTSSEMSSE